MLKKPFSIKQIMIWKGLKFLGAGYKLNYNVHGFKI